MKLGPDSCITGRNSGYHRPFGPMAYSRLDHYHGLIHAVSCACWDQCHHQVLSGSRTWKQSSSFNSYLPSSPRCSKCTYTMVCGTSYPLRQRHMRIISPWLLCSFELQRSYVELSTLHLVLMLPAFLISRLYSTFARVSSISARSSASRALPSATKLL